VLSGLGEVKVCTGYSINNEVITHMPFDIATADIEPLYETFPGWQDDLTVMRSYDNLPDSFKGYCKEISDRSECKISIISVGPDREETILC